MNRRARTAGPVDPQPLVTVICEDKVTTHLAVFIAREHPASTTLCGQPVAATQQILSSFDTRCDTCVDFALDGGMNVLVHPNGAAMSLKWLIEQRGE